MGEFNCVITKTDMMGHFNYSRAVNDLVQRFDLVDMCTTAPGRGREHRIETGYT